MKKRKFFLATIGTVLTSSLLFSCSNGAVTGNIDQTDTGIKASLVNIDGNPVANASVRVFTHKDSTGVWKDSVSTDENGNYTVSNLEAGRYSLWAETDSSVLFLEDIAISSEKPFDETGTLKPSKSVVVPVKVQPNHDARTVEVQIWGTPIRHNVEKSGHLILSKMPVGTYFTRLTSTLDDYSPTNDTLFITEGSKDTLDDTLELIYTGIPVVDGIKAEYDTLTGIATVRWNKSDYGDLDGYLLYRDTVGAFELSEAAITMTNDTLFEDDLNSVSSKSSFIYRVKLRANNNGNEGSVFYKDTIHYVNPKTELTLLKKDIDTAYLHYNYETRISIPEWIGEVSDISWKLGENSDISTGENQRFSFTVDYNLFDTIPQIVTVTGKSGRSLSDTISLVISNKFTKVEGKSGVDGIIQQPTVLGNTAYVTSYTTTDSSEQSLWKASDGVSWENMGVIDSKIMQPASNVVSWKDNLWIVGNNGDLYRSNNGSNWEFITEITNRSIRNALLKLPLLSIFENKLNIFWIEYINYDQNISLFEYDSAVKQKEFNHNGVPTNTISIYTNENKGVRPLTFNDNLYLTYPHGAFQSLVFVLFANSEVIDLYSDQGVHWTDLNGNSRNVYGYSTEYRNGVITSIGEDRWEMSFINGSSIIKTNTPTASVNLIQNPIVNNNNAQWTAYVYQNSLVSISKNGVFSDQPRN